MAYIKDRGNGTYLVRVSLGLDQSGKAIQKSKTFHPSAPNLPKAKLQKELNAFVFSFEAEASLSPSSAEEVEEAKPVEVPVDVPVNPTPLFSDYCVTYTEAKQKTMSPTTWFFNEKVMRNLLIPRLGHLHLNEIRPAHVQAIVDYLSTPDARKDRKRDTVLQPATIRRNLTVLQSILAFAVKQEYIDFNPAWILVSDMYRLLFLQCAPCSDLRKV